MTKSPITDTEQKFTLFPKLPTELRLKIWKYALPGPRVVPLCTSRSLRRRQKPCCVTNALITIRRACHEALDVVNKNYDKYVPVWKSQSDSIEDGEGHQAFIYINYDIDRVYIHKWGAFERVQEGCLRRIKHLAWRGEETGAHRFEWAVLRASFPSLESFTLVATQDFDYRPHKEEWKLLHIPSEFGTSLAPPRSNHGRFFMGARMKALKHYGQLAVKCAEVKRVRMDYQKYIEQHAEWENMLFHVAILAKRKIGSCNWRLSYFVETDITIDENGDFSVNCHWHDEPIDIGQGGILGLCQQPRGQVMKHQLCSLSICREQRWLNNKDAFWLDESYTEVVEDTDKVSEPSTEESEVVSDEGEDSFLEDDEASESSDSDQA